MVLRRILSGIEDKHMFYARFSELNENGSLMGVKDVPLESTTYDEAFLEAESYAEKHSSIARDLMLDYIEEE